jgi:hypothetical protein
MQPETNTPVASISISSRNLTDKELVRLADHYVYPNGLPIEWQKEILNRLAEHTKY